MKVDLAHLLASRDQELRAISAEVMSYSSITKYKNKIKYKKKKSSICSHYIVFDMIELILQMNQLQSDLRIARSVIAERDAENMRIRSLNNQVITTFSIW